MLVAEAGVHCLFVGMFGKEIDLIGAHYALLFCDHQ